MNELDDKKKQVIGLYGEMRLSMELHELGWQVHRAYIDEGIDFTITKYYCRNCHRYSNQYIRYTDRNGKREKCVTNLCEYCRITELDVISRYLQVKTSEGIQTSNDDVRKFSFHPKIRYNMGRKVFYVWIAVFDNIQLATYQITDNQKTELPIRIDGVVLKRGAQNTGYDYSVFNTRFYNDFNVLEQEVCE